MEETRAEKATKTTVQTWPMTKPRCHLSLKVSSQSWPKPEPECKSDSATSECYTVLIHFLTFSSHLCCTKDPSMDFYPWKSCPFSEVMVVTFLSSLSAIKGLRQPQQKVITTWDVFSAMRFGILIPFSFLVCMSQYVSIFVVSLSLHSQLLKQNFLRSPGSYMQSLPPPNP